MMDAARSAPYIYFNVSPTATNAELRAAYEKTRARVTNSLVVDRDGNEFPDLDTKINESAPPNVDQTGRPIPGTGIKADNFLEAMRKKEVKRQKLRYLEDAWKAIKRERGIEDEEVTTELAGVVGRKEDDHNLPPKLNGK